MKIGIGLPTTIPGVTRAQVIEWSKRADAAGFSCLGTIDRLVYPNWDSLVALSAAAAVTERIELTTSVLLAPPRESAAVIAKQGATIHVLSGGRFVLGTAPGGRDDDYEPFGVSTKGRGKRLDEMLDLIKRLWAGEEVGYAGGVGPDVSAQPAADHRRRPGRCRLPARRQVRRRLDDGRRTAREVRRGSRQARGRLPRRRPQGDPAGDVAHLLLARRRSRGPDSLHDRRPTTRSSGEYDDMVVAGTAKGADEVRERVKGFEQQGCDELIMFPASSDPDQVDKLAAAVL